MIGVDEDLDWGGFASDSDSDADLGLNTDISPDGSVEDLHNMTVPHIDKGMTDISPEGSVEDPSEVHHREQELVRSKNQTRGNEDKAEKLFPKRQLTHSHTTVDNSDALHTSRTKSPGASRRKQNRELLHSETAPPIQDVTFVPATVSRARSPIARALSNKVGIAPSVDAVMSYANDHPPERNVRTPNKVAPSVGEEIRSPTSTIASSYKGDVQSPNGQWAQRVDPGQLAATPIPYLETAKIWNQLSFRLKPQFAQYTEVHSFANAVQVVPSADGARVLCATADSTVRMIDATSGKVLGMYEGHSDRVLAVAVSEYIPDEKNSRPQVVVAGSRDETVCIWDFKSARCKHILSKHEGAVWAVAVTTAVARPVAVSGSSDCSIRSWDINTGEEINIFRGHSDTVLALSIHPGSGDPDDPPRVVSGGADHMVRIWDLLTGRHCRMLEGHTDDVNAISLVTDPSATVFIGVKIISGGRDRSVRVWDMHRGAQLAEFHGHVDCVYGVAGIVGKFASLQTSNTGEAPAVLVNASKSGVGHLNKASSVWIRPDEGGLKRDSNVSFIVVSCGEDRTLRLWNVLEEKQMVVSKLHKGSVKGVSLGAVRMKTVDGIVGSAMLMATCSWDKSVLFYDLDNLLVSKKSKSCCTVS